MKILNQPYINLCISAIGIHQVDYNVNDSAKNIFDG